MWWPSAARCGGGRTPTPSSRRGPLRSRPPTSRRASHPRQMLCCAAAFAFWCGLLCAEVGAPRWGGRASAAWPISPPTSRRAPIGWGVCCVFAVCCRWVLSGSGMAHKGWCRLAHVRLWRDGELGLGLWCACRPARRRSVRRRSSCCFAAVCTACTCFHPTSCIN